METLLPDWAPNIHPMIVHFPIVLWIVAVLFDLLFLFLPKSWLRNMIITLYSLGAVGSLASYLSGKQAIDIVSVPMQAELIAGNHADWAYYTLIYFGAYTAIRLLLFWKKWDKIKTVAILMFLLGVAGIGLLSKTADLGGRLVYEYGVGTNK